MAQQAENISIGITYGHDDTRVLLQFTRAVNNFTMSEPQCEEMIASLQNALAKLREHKRKRAATKAAKVDTLQ